MTCQYAKVCIIDAAAMSFERFVVAVNGEGKKPVLDDIRCFARQKSFTKFRRAEQFNRMSPNRAFPIAAVPSAIAESLNGLPKRKHRPTMPRVACLANLVKVSHKLSDYSGRIVGLTNRINPSCALGICYT